MMNDARIAHRGRCLAAGPGGSRRRILHHRFA
ncbi:hypothetical protein DM47_2864 [Burkholderia mallei]|nr:hypothetical protein DM47_2864 [Burkholderia mallei]